MKANFRSLFLAEWIVIGVVICIFKFTETRLIAGALAGSVFVILGGWIFLTGLRDRSFRRSLTFWAGCLHLFASSLPLMITRFLNQTTSFQEVSVLGLSGPTFHRLSTSIYMILLVATFIDWMRVRRKSVATAP